ncbi:3-hydroxyacyl-CoA dehydrogenase [Mesorhizobium sp. CO1-1-4]|uniref:3-hydroxyacyl-CoA dehydrogenase n=1 Tax=Mesorhizobium sp. CO1-1-4 TaxID=2876633 RepID=UPI001CCA9647|nr:3-hydroxyacyl-CoA dehydrogenase [Mesorhizobium sp. CO1-1-4]MBZ9738710.1 3-hydroxyacyl-CoA dehydrogenase [Mesorhizobium sp. CO1-1-4]
MAGNLEQVAVIGGGLVGSGWAIVFARAGIPVRFFDANEDIRQTAPSRIRASLSDMREFGLIDDVDTVAQHIDVVDSLVDAVAAADYVQESVFERVDVKKAVCAEIGAAIRDDAVVGSSSSGIPASMFTEHAPRRSRFLIAHPVNPPHLVPLVELVPAPWTDREIVSWLRQAMEQLGQVPIVVNREIEGFILNRLQGALLNEAWALFDAGLASVTDIDRTIAHGLGLRWSFMGPFETIDLNAPGGVEDYAQRLGPLYHTIAEARRDPKPWSPEMIERVTAERRAELPKQDLRARSAWRDRRLMALVAHKQHQPK